MNKKFKIILSSVVLSAFMTMSAAATDMIPPVQGEAVKGRIVIPKCGNLIYSPYNEQMSWAISPMPAFTQEDMKFPIQPIWSLT